MLTQRSPLVSFWEVWGGLGAGLGVVGPIDSGGQRLMPLRASPAFRSPSRRSGSASVSLSKDATSIPTGGSRPVSPKSHAVRSEPTPHALADATSGGFDRAEDFALVPQQDDAPAALYAAGELGGAVFLAGSAGRHGENIVLSDRGGGGVLR